MPGDEGHDLGRLLSFVSFAVLPRQGNHPYAALLNNGEMTRPVGSTIQNGKGFPNNVAGRQRDNTKQDNTGICRKSGPKGEFAEILIKRQQYPPIRIRNRKNMRILASGRSVRAQRTSCPANRNASTASPGKFSLARNFTGHAPIGKIFSDWRRSLA